MICSFCKPWSLALLWLLVLTTTHAEGLDAPLPEGDETRALHSYLADPDPRVRATAALRVANIHLQRRDAKAASLWLDRVAQGAGLADDPSLAAALRNSRARVAEIEGEGEVAARLYAEAAALAEGAGEEATALASHLNRVHLLDPEAALAELQRLLVRIDALPAGVERARLHLSAAFALSQSPLPRPRWLGDAWRGYRAVARAPVADAPRLLGEALAGEAHLYELEGRYGEALGLVRQALALPELAEAHDLRLQWEWLRGRLLRALGEPLAAAEALRRAVYHIERIRNDIPVAYADGRSSFRTTLQPVYQGLADLLLSLAAEAQTPERARGLLLEARAAVEAIKVAELEDYFRDPCLVEAHGSPHSLETVDPGVAVLYPLLLADRVELMLSSGEAVERFPIALTPGELETQARQLREYLQQPAHNRFMRPARRLYEALIAPLLPTLTRWGTTTLVVVPDGQLRTVPFAALYDGERFLVERFALVTSPGLTLIDPSPVRRTQGEMLVLGLAEGVQGFPPLPAVVEETDEVRRLARGQRLLDAEYTLGGVSSELQRTPVRALHFATHGQFGGEAQENFLLAYDGRLDMPHLEGLIAGQSVDLLTLSACQTALGDDRAALGLAGLAVKAGARSVVATLWTVNDGASAHAMEGFYRRLYADPTLPVAAALAQTQRAMIAEERWWHPAYWAPFLLIGNWR